jgi:hypothetical protein
MVDLWRTFLQLEVFWSKFAPMDPWETLVFYAVMFSLALMVFTVQRGQGRASCGTLIFSLFFSVIRCHHAVCQLSRISAGCANQDWPPLPSSIVTAALTATPSSDLNTQVESYQDEQEVLRSFAVCNTHRQLSRSRERRLRFTRDSECRIQARNVVYLYPYKLG